MSLIHNERIKLTATWLNTLAATTIATGVVAPLVAIVFGFPTTATISLRGFVLACVTWLFLGVAPPFLGERFASETAGMSAFEFYALFGSPLLLLLVALAVVWITGRQDKHDDERRTPAE